MSRSASSPANTLLEDSTPSDRSESAVCDVLNQSAETNLLVVSYRRDPEVWFQNWRTQFGTLPTEVGFVRVGEATRSASAVNDVSSATHDQSAGSTQSASRTLVEAVSDPTDLATVGIRVSEFLESWTDDGRQTVVLFDSLSRLLDAVTLERAFRFLHVFAGRVESVDGSGFYLLDPTAHDDRAVSVVRDLADATVSLGDAGPA